MGANFQISAEIKILSAAEKEEKETNRERGGERATTTERETQRERERGRETLTERGREEFCFFHSFALSLSLLNFLLHIRPLPLPSSSGSFPFGARVGTRACAASAHISVRIGRFGPPWRELERESGDGGRGRNGPGAWTSSFEYF